MYYSYISSPYGKLLLAGEEHALSLIAFSKEDQNASVPGEDAMDKWQKSEVPFRQAAKQLQEYFDGKRTTFDLPLAIHGTQFQRSVLSELQKIPYGTTSTYSQIAEAIGKPKAVRAVGMVNSRNLLPIVIPCHRVIGKDGSLTGFNGGIDVKQGLLDHERQHSQPG